MTVTEYWHVRVSVKRLFFFVAVGVLDMVTEVQTSTF